MSVSGLSITSVNVYGVVTTQDIYAANQEAYYLKYSGIRARFMYLEGVETFIDGKEMVVPISRIYLPSQLNVIESDVIVDIFDNNIYDILNVYETDYRGHMQVDAKNVQMILPIISIGSTSSSSIDSSSSSSSSSESSSTSSSSSSTYYKTSSSSTSSSSSSQSKSSISSASESSWSDSSRSSQSLSSSSTSSSTSSSSSSPFHSSDSTSSSSSQSKSSISSQSESSWSDSSRSSQSLSSESTSSSTSSSSSSPFHTSSSSTSSSSQSKSSNSSSSGSSWSDSSRSSQSNSSSSTSSSSSTEIRSSSSSSSSSPQNCCEWYDMEGHSIPLVNQVYKYAGSYNGYPCWKGLTSTYYIFADPNSLYWLISSTLGGTAVGANFLDACPPEGIWLDATYTYDDGTLSCGRSSSSESSSSSSSYDEHNSSSSSSTSSSSSSSRDEFIYVHGSDTWNDGINFDGYYRWSSIRDLYLDVATGTKIIVYVPLHAGWELGLDTWGPLYRNANSVPRIQPPVYPVWLRNGFYPNPYVYPVLGYYSCSLYTNQSP